MECLENLIQQLSSQGSTSAQENPAWPVNHASTSSEDVHDPVSLHGSNPKASLCPPNDTQSVMANLTGFASGGDFAGAPGWIQREAESTNAHLAAVATSSEETFAFADNSLEALGIATTSPWPQISSQDLIIQDR